VGLLNQLQKLQRIDGKLQHSLHNWSMSAVEIPEVKGVAQVFSPGLGSNAHHRDLSSLLLVGSRWNTFAYAEMKTPFVSKKIVET
jgi:hypothetical protein